MPLNFQVDEILLHNLRMNIQFDIISPKWRVFLNFIGTTRMCSSNCNGRLGHVNWPRQQVTGYLAVKMLLLRLIVLVYSLWHLIKVMDVHSVKKAFIPVNN